MCRPPSPTIPSAFLFAFLFVCLFVCLFAVTGQELRCDVFVDMIERIEITTRTRELLLEEEPERFDLRAFDEEGTVHKIEVHYLCMYVHVLHHSGNMFSTIRGQIIHWSLLTDLETPNKHQSDSDDILTFVPFEESSYATDPVIGALENKVSCTTSLPSLPPSLPFQIHTHTLTHTQ